jgi:hypothetical protein
MEKHRLGGDIGFQADWLSLTRAPPALPLLHFFCGSERLAAGLCHVWYVGLGGHYYGARLGLPGLGLRLGHFGGGA